MCRGLKGVPGLSNCRSSKKVPLYTGFRPPVVNNDWVQRSVLRSL